MINPNPKRGKLHYGPYEDYIRTRPCAITGGRGILSHRRELCGGGTGIKPPSFHCLSIDPIVHNGEHLDGAEIEKEVVADLCLHNIIRYLQDRSTLFQKVQTLDAIGAFIIEEGI